MPPQRNVLSCLSSVSHGKGIYTGVNSFPFLLLVNSCLHGKMRVFIQQMAIFNTNSPDMDVYRNVKD